MQFFVGFCNFYRRFIKDFSKIVRSLVRLTQKEVIFEWNHACQTVFDHMKKRMTEASILRHFDQNREAILETDSSDYVNGDILSQYDDKGTLHPVAYYSKNLSPAECNYETGSKMFLNERNIVTARPSKKLDDKMLGPFTNLGPVGSSYKLELPESMRVHDVFHPDLLRPAADDPLPGQKNEPPGPIVVKDEDEWEIDDILNSRRYRRRLQYRVKWKGYDNDLNWYNADDDEFMNAQEVVDDFHTKYSRKAH